MLHILEDTDRALALIRGKGVRNILELACAVDRASWSVSAKGFVVNMSDLPDIVAMAQYANAPVHFRRVNPHG